MPSTRLLGHALQHEGHAFEPGETSPWLRVYGSWTGVGLCECGEVSPVLTSDRARKAWHREHKDAIRESLTHEFAPDWCLAPAAALREWMKENGLSVRVLASMARDRVVTKEGAALLIQQVLDREPLTAAHAKALERGTGISERFWLNYEHNYRAGLAAGLVDTTPEERT